MLKLSEETLNLLKERLKLTEDHLHSDCIDLVYRTEEDETLGESISLLESRRRELMREIESAESEALP